MIGACGIDCGVCQIHLASGDRGIAEKLAAGFRQKKLIPDAYAEMFRCDGCHGNRDQHWSANCWILQCSIDRKGLENCSQCDDFPCNRLTEWSMGKPQYEEALQRLRSMR